MARRFFRQILPFALVALLLCSFPALARDKYRIKNAELVQDSPEPMIRIPVAHAHGFSPCYGWLFITRTEVEFRVTRPDSDKEHSFKVARDKLSVKGFLGLVRMSIGDRHWDIGVARRVNIEENKRLHGLNQQSSDELRSSFEDFDGTVAAIREKTLQAGSVPPAGSAAGAPRIEAAAAVRAERPTVRPNETRVVPMSSAARTPEEAARMLRRDLRESGRGVFAMESQMAFNVLDYVFFDPETKQLSLIGHFDRKYAGPRIPYLQHLAALLESPKPEFSLTWTKDSQQRIDRLLSSAVDPRESDRISTQLGQVVDASGTVNATGRLMLPAVGIYPIDDHRAPGSLGAGAIIDSQTALVLSSVQPNSPAERAGLQVGDWITHVNGWRVYTPRDFVAAIRYAGAGSTTRISYRRNRMPMSVETTLNAAQNFDPWYDVTRYDLMARMYKDAGNAQAAKGVLAFALVRQAGNSALQPTARTNLYQTFNMGPAVNALIRKEESGGTVTEADYNQLNHDFCAQIDEVFGFDGHPVMDAYDAAMRSSRNTAAAFDRAFGFMDELIRKQVAQMLDKAFTRPEGIQVPPELVEEYFKVHPEMMPEYLGIPAESQLARAMFEGDYLIKRLAANPDLKRTISAYQTKFEYEIKNPKYYKSQSAYRMWISVAKMETAQSPDHHTLNFRDVQMRFNMRNTTMQGQDLAPEAGGYQEFLTSFYPQFEEHFPVLHELREAAKLAAAAKWIQQQSADFRMPQEGRVSWHGPAQVPGLVYFYLSPDPNEGIRKTHVKIVASGGVSLEPFPQSGVVNPFPEDTSVVDLRDLPAGKPLVVAPEPYANTELSRILNKQIDVPVPRPVGWTAQATDGKRILHSTSVMLENLPAMDAERQMELREKLLEAQRLARQLDQADRALNVLNSDVAGRAQQFKDLQEQIAKDKDGFAKSVVSVLRQVGSDARSTLQEDKGLDSTTREVLEGFDAVDLADENADKGVPGKMWEVLKESTKKWAESHSLFEDAGDSVAGVGAMTPKPIPLKPIFDTVGQVKLVGSILKTEAQFGKLEFVTDYKVDQLETSTTKDLEAIQKVTKIRSNLLQQLQVVMDGIK